MLFEALGPLNIRHNQNSLTPSAAKPRVVLALLLINANRVVSNDTLIDEVWDHRPPTSAVNTLQTYIYQLRKLLADLRMGEGEGPHLDTSPGGYALHVPDEMFDIAIFNALADRGARALTSGNPAETASLLSRALAMWRGDALTGVELGNRLSSHVTYLHERRLRTIEQYNEARLAMGHSASLVASLKDLAHTHPDYDAFQRQLMLALSRSGRRAEALSHFRRLRARLTDELGLDPSRQLEDMHEAILTARSEVAEDGLHIVAPALPKPAQLLPDCATYRGYREPLKQARAALETPVRERQAPPVIQVSGPPGAGLRSFATHLAHMVKDTSPDGQFFQRVDRTGVSATLECFLQAVGIPASRIPAAESARAAMFRSWTADRRVLVVLHNVANEDELESLLPTGPACGSIVTCVTAPQWLPGSQHFRLAGVDLESALSLLSDHTGTGHLPSLAETVVNQCDRLPGLIAEIGSLIAHQPGYDMAAVSRLLAEDSWALRQMCGGHDRMVRRIRETVAALCQSELAALSYLCAASQPPTLPDLVDALATTTLTMASAISRLLRCGLVAEQLAPSGPARSAEPAYEVPLLVKEYLRSSARPPEIGMTICSTSSTLGRLVNLEQKIRGPL
jgi:DNA-binding SARP family transcriptional activator